MPRQTAILLVCLAANIALAIVIFRHPQISAPNAKKVVTDQKTEPQAMGSADTSSANATNTSDATPFNWAQMEADNYKEYIIRLRAFGVPERTIREMILADISRMYAPKEAACRSPKIPENPNFWEVRSWGSQTPVSKEQRAQLRALQREQADLAKQLLGDDVFELMAKDSGDYDWVGSQFGELPHDVRDKVAEMLMRYQDDRSDIEEKDRDSYQDRQKDLKKRERELLAELSTVVTPEQILRYQLISSDAANEMRFKLNGLDLDENEFRAIFEFKQASSDLGSLTADERKQKRAELLNTFTNALGVDRYKEFRLADDENYRSLFQGGVARETILKVADMQKTVQSAINKVRADKTLTPDQQKAALRALRTETEGTLSDLLGERRGRAYVGSSGYWVRSIAPNE